MVLGAARKLTAKAFRDTAAVHLHCVRDTVELLPTYNTHLLKDCDRLHSHDNTQN